MSPLLSSGARLVASNASNYSCNLLVANDDLKDGKIPQVLALAVGAWLVSRQMCPVSVYFNHGNSGHLDW